MDGAEIDRITAGAKPVTDFYPKRLSDTPPDKKAIHNFAAPYFEAKAAAHRFPDVALRSNLAGKHSVTVEPLFRVREARYRSSISKGNWLAELDMFLRGSRLRTPVLELLQSNEFRLSMAERVAGQSTVPPVETMPDLIAGALAARYSEGHSVTRTRRPATGRWSRSLFLADLSVLPERPRGKSRSPGRLRCRTGPKGFVRSLALEPVAIPIRVSSASLRLSTMMAATRSNRLFLML